MKKRIHHMGMGVTKDAHDDFHRTAPDLGPKQHAALMKRMGIAKEQDEEWHRTHLTLGEQRARGLVRLDPLAVGAAFVEWCAKQGWIVDRGKDRFATPEGVRELAARFEIVVERNTGR
ncbi:MAG TPA: hypothetical protein VFE22_15890 [Edaphobacter sp.]|nr:hypothetical protein [Edaphobacter sp.]